MLRLLGNAHTACDTTIRDTLSGIGIAFPYFDDVVARADCLAEATY
jgi:hypothetical protein